MFAAPIASSDDADGAGERGDVPEAVAELLHDRVAVERGAVEEVLLHVLGDLAGLAGEAEGGVGEAFRRGLAGAQGAGGELLVVVEGHRGVCGGGPLPAFTDGRRYDSWPLANGSIRVGF